MTIEDSNEIKRIFYGDSYRKKKIGSNIFKRTGIGSDRAGVPGGLTFPKYNFKKYEKNSKVKEKNIFEEVVDYDFFKSLSKDNQKQLLQKWMSKFTNKEIYEKMGISENKFYELRNELGIDRRGETVKITKEEFEKYKNGNIDIYKFKLLPDDQKFEIVDYIQKTKGLSNPEMADLIGYSYNSFNTLKSEWRKAFKERSENVLDYDDSFLIESEENKKEEDDNKKEMSKNDGVKEVSHKSYSSADEKGDVFEINLSGFYDGEAIKEKLNALASMLNKDKEYGVVIKIKDNY